MPGGRLIPKSPATVATGTQPIGIVVTPAGRNVCVTNAQSSTISEYAVGRGGTLNPSGTVSEVG